MNIVRRILDGDSRSVIVKKNILWSLVLRGISILTFLLIVPLTLDYVSSELYGVWLTISTIILWVGFFDAGFSLGLKNRLAEAIALDNGKRAKQLVSTTYVVMMLIFIPLCLLLLPVVDYVDWPSLLKIDALYEEDILMSMRIVIVAFCIQMIVQVIVTVCASFQQTALSSSFNVIGNALSLIVIWILTKTVHSSLAILTITMAFAPILVMLIGSLILYRGKFKSVTPSLRLFKFSIAKDIFSLGYKFFILRIQVIVITNATNFLISYVAGPVNVTIYSIAHRYLAVAVMFFDIVMGPMWPAFTDAFTKKDYSWMNSTYTKMVKLCSIVIIGILLMIPISPVVYELWIGEEPYIPILMTIMVGICYITQVLSNLNILLINGIGCIKLQTYAAILVSILHIPLSIVFGEFIGAYGVVLSLIIMNTIYAVFSSIQMKKILNQSATGIWIK